MDKFSELEKLSELKDKGILTEEEFQKEKEKILYKDKEKGNYIVPKPYHQVSIEEMNKEDYKIILAVKNLFISTNISSELDYKITMNDLKTIQKFIVENNDYITFTAQFRKSIDLFFVPMHAMLYNRADKYKVFNIGHFTVNLLADIRNMRGEEKYNKEQIANIARFIFSDYPYINLESYSSTSVFTHTIITDSNINNNYSHNSIPTQKQIQEPLTPDSYANKVILHTIIASIVTTIIITIMQESGIISTAQSAGQIAGTYAVYPLFVYLVYLASTLWQNNNKDWFYALIPVYGLVAPIYTPYKSIKTIIAIIIAGFISLSFYVRIPLFIADLLK